MYLLSNERPIGDLAWMRIASSAEPERFRACMARTLTALGQGDDIATKAWRAGDPVRLAAEIEALAGVRRLNSFRKGPK
ncbi:MULTISPECIES: hypothetical protein [unclassified Streptomyces]|uniref:hypothetical protein n=1 Tax=unclassified Streptomyces TaxID=2593676 RepID=UPI002025574A|nr:MULTISPECIES: hypothetical protein [unclassified Streptomyces]MCX4550535.1 hypothetical protein [Streptomyces sp. NBC_01500]WSC21982.1 hypothetical protein OIE60_21140 [Streptomyces sp. NBC_01766]